MFNDPKYKNLVNDISGILSENIKNHFDNLLPEAIVDQVSLAADKIEEMSDEFYRRVFEMKKNKKKNDKANGAY